MTSLDSNSKLSAYLHWLKERGLPGPKYYQATQQLEPVVHKTMAHDLKKTPIYLFVLAPAQDLKEPAQRDLLKKIIEATHINQSQLQILSAEHMDAKLELFSPQQVLGFGVSKKEGWENQGFSFLALPSLSTLLTEPTAKRDVWNHLKVIMAEPDFPKRLLSH